MAMAANSNTDFKELLKVLGRVLRIMFRGYCFSLVAVVVCIIVSALVLLESSLFTQSLIDDFIVPMMAQESPDFEPLKLMLSQLACIFAVGVVTTYAYNRIMVNVCQGTVYNVREQIFSRMETLPIKYFDTNSHGDIMSVYTNDVDTLRQLISQSIPQVINSLFTIILVFVSMIVLSVPLTVLSVVMIGVMIFVSGKLAAVSGKHFVAQQNDIGAVNGYVEEMVEGQKVVKIFNHEDKCIADFDAINDKLRESAFKANMFANVTMPVNSNLGNISYVLCAILGAVLALSGGFGLTLGTLVAFLTLNRSFTQPVTQVSQQLSMIVMAMAGASRIFKIIDAQPEIDEGHFDLVRAVAGEDGTLAETGERTGTWAWKDMEDPSAPLVRMRGDIVFKDVDFSYVEGKQVLFDIDLYANAGQKIAFVGETGAGKTTMTNLINRFYDIQGGTISYDGIPVRSIKKSALRHSLGIVLQDTRLFTGTVMDNIRFGRLDATDEECIEAAKLANADGFIRHLENGYDTVLTGNGGSLSQGQRQLLAIARAAVADPPVLILDEATSSIDTRTEGLVQRGMDALMRDRTSFVIAHRLSTVRDSDCIMVMDHGRIIERGSHEELLEQRGKYYQLYTGKAVNA